MQTQNINPDKQFFAIEKDLLVGILTYLNERPHKEVADAIVALRNLAPVKLQKEEIKEVKNEAK